jgi:hypothetical protein
MGGFPWYTNSTISLTNFSSLSLALTAGKGPKCSLGPDLLSLRSSDEKKQVSLFVFMGKIGASFDLHVRMTS